MADWMMMLQHRARLALIDNELERKLAHLAVMTGFLCADPVVNWIADEPTCLRVARVDALKMMDEAGRQVKDFLFESVRCGNINLVDALMLINERNRRGTPMPARLMRC